MIRVGIVGISGYSGLTALELLLKHPHVRVTYVSANNSTGPVSKIWPHLKGKTKLVCDKFNDKAAAEQCDFILLAVPHTVAMKITPKLLEANVRVIDISADYRLKNKQVYKKWYGTEHKDAQNLKNAVYGLPELFREKIKKASLIANPGCYPTAALLSLVPLAYFNTDGIESITIDAKSGISGAGRKLATGSLFSELNSNFKAYKVLNHQHTPEISQTLTAITDKEFELNFVPHLLPIERGILETIYVRLSDKVSLKQVQSVYSKFYKTEQFVRILDLGQQPEIKHVVGSNYCDIGFAVQDNLVVITSTIDNLVKGASGQAIQNMNIMSNFKENEGLL